MCPPREWTDRSSCAAGAAEIFHKAGASWHRGSHSMEACLRGSKDAEKDVLVSGPQARLGEVGFEEL